MTDPAIKWDVVAGPCEPGPTGSATLCFYTNVGPSEESELPVFIIKNGQGTCEGILTGDCPAPPCSIDTEKKTWGGVKADFRYLGM